MNPEKNSLPPAELILFVKDLSASEKFYRILLDKSPVISVPGMVAFDIHDSLRLGLMPETGIEKILGDKVPSPATGNGIPRCELYLRVENAGESIIRGLNAGAVLVSPLAKRSWNESAGYLSDPDGHIIAFAEIQ
jgi:lactoylglutathione lyase